MTRVATSSAALALITSLLREGAEASEHGLPLSDNPYMLRNDANAKLWERGYLDAERTRQLEVR